jgi:hypothetical protein
VEFPRRDTTQPSIHQQNTRRHFGSFFLSSFWKRETIKRKEKKIEEDAFAFPDPLVDAGQAQPAVDVQHQEEE